LREKGFGMKETADTQLACNVLLSSDIAVGHCVIFERRLNNHADDWLP